MTVTLLAMFGKDARARAVLPVMARVSPETELAAIARGTSDHPLSIRRARLIARRIDDPDRTRRWQGLLVRHMHTRAIRAIAARTPPWADLPALTAELAARDGPR